MVEKPTRVRQPLLRAIQQQSGHNSLATLMGYIRQTVELNRHPPRRLAWRSQARWRVSA
jgi:hypothetical protein